MAKKQTEEQKLMRTWWVELVLAVAFVGLAYGFVSLAINSGSLWQYALSIIFLVVAARFAWHAARSLLKR